MTSPVPLAQAENRDQLRHELTQLTPLSHVRGLQVFTFKAEEAPTVMREVGRIRELIFRDAGAGRNLERDLDPLDFGPNCYQQLLVWDPKRSEVVALYRFKLGVEAIQDLPSLRTTQLFNYTEEFKANILPFAIELGRSVVNHEAKAARFGFFALWVGLEALLHKYPHVEFFFGNVSLYKTLGQAPLNLLVSFCQLHYRPPTRFLAAKPELILHAEWPNNQNYLNANARERIQALQGHLDHYHIKIPKILQSYLSLSTDIWFDDAARDADFGEAYELSIIVPVKAIAKDRRLKLAGD
ncbi:MAG: GNAT family N-acetyltransferase [Idiomarina sp.]|nr:GNAT family N-acetyltransferase [Idiomarina sp.]